MALFRTKFACILAISNPVFMCESCKGSVWESVKNCSRLCTRAKNARSWSVAPAIHYRTKVPSWPGRLLAAWTRDSTQSRDQAARTPYLAKYDFSHSFSPYYIYTLIPTIYWELPRKILREKPYRKQDWLIHNLYLRDSSNSSALFLSIVKSLRGLLPKPFLTISISMRVLFGALGSS